MKTIPVTRPKDLQTQVACAQAEVRPDGYEMSIGELFSIYDRHEILIRPDYQRLFRWSLEQKSRLIESVLIGIPIPPIFVFQDSNGRWELVDGLQRVSTFCEFKGVLRKDDGSLYPPSVLASTAMMPALEGASWEEGPNRYVLPEPLKLKILRARIRIEILQVGSSPRSRFELFQRLNTGGSLLTPQEIRNCSVIMVKPDFHKWMCELAEYPAFKLTTNLTDAAVEKQRPMELVAKYLVCNFVAYRSEWDLHEYLDEGIITVALDAGFDLNKEASKFKLVFDLVEAELGETAFRRTKRGKIVGSFSDAAYEAIIVGARANLAKLTKSQGALKKLADDLWAMPDFVKNTGAGVRGTTRVSKIIPFSKSYFKQ